jgi:hypothetical protein
MDPIDQWVDLSFVAGLGRASGAIQMFGDFFSHVDFQDDDGSLWGARSDVITPLSGGPAIPAGVQQRPDNYEKWLHRTVFRVPCTMLAKQSYRAFNVSQQHKPYDKFDILGIMLTRNWRNPDHWICSELQAAAGESSDLWGILDAQGERKLFVPDNWIKPGPLAMLVSGINGVTIRSSY